MPPFYPDFSKKQVEHPLVTISPHNSETGMRRLAVQMRYREGWGPDRWTAASSSHCNNGLSNRDKPSKSAKQNSQLTCLFLPLSPEPQKEYCIWGTLCVIPQWVLKSWRVWRDKVTCFQVTLGNAPLFPFPATSVHQQTWVLRCNERKSCECNTLQWLSLIRTSSQFTERA